MSSRWNPTDFDPHAPEFLSDPFPTYRLFRDHAPVAKVSPYGAYWVFRHADVSRVLTQRDLFLKHSPTPSPPVPPFEVLANLKPGLFNADPPEHTDMRRAMEPLLARASVDADAVTSALARELLRQGRRGQHIELYSDFAMPLPPRVLFTVLGLPEAHWPAVRRWVDAYVAGHDITQAPARQWYGATSAMAMLTYYQALIGGCPVHAVPERLIDLMRTEGVACGMAAQQVQATAQNLTIAGYASTTFLIATGTYRLLCNPGQYALLRQAPERLRGAIAEMLRYDSPAQLVDRAVAEDTELGGVALRAGDRVTAVIGSANHDERVFPEPDAFRIERDNARQIAFGDGIHTCLGAPLVAKVAPAAFRALFATFPRLSLQGVPQWQTDPYLRSVVNLPLAVGA